AQCCRAVLSPTARATGAAAPRSSRSRLPTKSSWSVTTEAPPGSTTTPSFAGSASMKPRTLKPQARATSATTLPWPPPPQISTGSASAATEALHGGVAFVADPLACEHLPHRAEEYSQVEPERAILHVPEVERAALLPGKRVASIDLRPARQTGPHVV